MHNPEKPERNQELEVVDYRRLVDDFLRFETSQIPPSDQYKKELAFFSVQANVPHVPGANLRVVAHKYDPKIYEDGFLQFAYTKPIEGRQRVAREFASLGLLLAHSDKITDRPRSVNSYHLETRFVNEELRDKGIGTKLFAHVEGFMQALANKRGEPMDITTWGSQMSALQWAIKNGFEPDPEWRDVVEKILRDPEGARVIDYKDPVDRTWKRDTIIPADAAGETKRDLYDQRIKSVLRKTYQPQSAQNT